jgi:hypothetical protein
MPSGSSRAADAELERRLARLRRFADLQDSRFSILGIRFGWDALIGLVPGVGDAATTAMAAWIVAESARLGASRAVLARMSLNVLVDLMLGAVPLLGDLFDVAFKANRRNVRLLERHLARRGRSGTARATARCAEQRTGETP